MLKFVSKPASQSLILVLLCLAAVPVLAAELRLIDGEYRYYENGKLVIHQNHIRALPGGEQTAIAIAGAVANPTEANPENVSIGIATASRTFEIEPDPDTDEEIGDPVCVVTTFESEVSTETDGAISAASASAGGWDGMAEADADENVPSASATTSAPGATLSVDPLNGDQFIENDFASITVSGDDADDSTGNHHFVALIGDTIVLRVGSYAASAAVYPDSAAAFAGSQMAAELQADVLDCQLSLTALVDTGEGSIQADPDQGSYQFGDEVQLTAIPEQGWSFAGWSGDASGMDNPLTLTIDNNTEVFASFETAIHTVTAEVGDGDGEITPASQDVDHGDDATFTVSPDTGWSVTSVTGDTCAPMFDSGDQWFAENITEDCTVTANFAEDTFDVTTEVVQGDGTITPATQNVVFDDTATFTVTPETGWSVESVSGDTCSPTLVGGNDWEAAGIQDDCHVEASFVINTYTVTAEVGDGDGEITPASQDVDHGDDATFTVSPDTGWSVTSVTGDTCAPMFDSGDQWFAENITEDCTVAVNFEIDTYTIGGTLSGLSAGNSVTLQNNNTDDSTLTDNGDFIFSMALDDLTTYEVTVLDQPEGQFCSVTNASGTLAGSDVDDVAVDCVDIELSLSREEIQFTELNPGDSDEQMLTLTNTSQADLVIEQFSTPDAPFGLDPQDCAPLPHTLIPGQSCTIVLTFSPQEFGDFNDELLIESSAISSPDSVSLSGSAAPPAVPVPALGLPALLLLLFGIFLLGLRQSHR